MDDADFIPECISTCEQFLIGNRPFRVVPVLKGYVVAAFAWQPSSMGAILDGEFLTNWKIHIDLPFLDDSYSVAFEQALCACIEFSGILSCRDLENLHPEEEKVVEKILHCFGNNLEKLEDFVKQEGTEIFEEAMEYLKATKAEVNQELEATEAGETITDPLWKKYGYSQTSGDGGRYLEILSMGMLLRQAERGALN